MDAVLLCDGAISSHRSGRVKKFDIRTSGSKSNLNLQINEISSAILQDLDPISADLVRIASYVYAGDQSISRGTEKDVYGSQWTRNMNFVIPVSNPTFWSEKSIISDLVDTLSFLTGDNFAFEFVQGSLPTSIQHALPGMSPFREIPDCVILFSGGADSLCATVEKVAQDGRRPVLVSHRSVPLLDTRQSQLADYLRKYFPNWYFPHISIWAHLRGPEAEDYTQRSRSFLYLSFAAAVAHQIKVTDIYLADNGIVSINVPTNAQLIGTYASRTTHPKFMQKAQNLFGLIFNPKPFLSNPLHYRTRAETLEILRTNNCEPLLQETVSCAHTRQSKLTPHCGVCSQCVDRRFASIAAHMDANDAVLRYKLDIFTDPIKDGIDRTMVVSYVRFGRDVRQMTDEEIFSRFPELLDCIIPGDKDAAISAKELANMVCRHAEQVSNVMEDQLRQGANSLFEASLPESSLIRLIATGTHNQDPRSLFALRIAERLQKGIPKAFHSKGPKNEVEVQEVADAILAGAHEDLDRELPMLSFASISTKPDFSKLDSSIFYIEIKYVRTRSRLNSVLTEITSRTVIYKKQGAYTLFAVYDPSHFIPDDNKFRNDISDDSCVVVIIR